MISAMKSMECVVSSLLAALVAVLAMPGRASAVSCPDRTPAPILSAAPESLDCQKAVAREGWRFLNAKLKAMSKCLLREPIGTCPGAKESEKINKAVSKAAEKIAKFCAGDAAQAGLASSYSALTDDALIHGCLLSQHNVGAAVLLGNSTGISTEPFPGQDETERAKCMKELSKSGIKYALGAQKAARKCIDKQMKQAVVDELGPICIGRWEGGVFIPPSDAKTAEKLAKLQSKLEEKIQQRCESGETLGYIPSLFACRGAENVADLQACLVCGGWEGAVDTLEQSYAESGSYVANGAGAIQAAVTAATAGDKLLIGSGDYVEQVTIATAGLQLVGCGGASDDRPRLVRPAGPGPFNNAIFANGVDGLGFQSLAFFNWDRNGIIVIAAEGVTFRDIFADCNLQAEYGIFPIRSNNVLIEASEVVRATDAAIYVGQSSNIVVRYNEASESVAGIEIENSGNAVVHNNHAHGNTGGILVFKLPDLTVQLSDCHEIDHNVSENNNVPNFGSGFVGLVPQGTGMIVLSNDSSVFKNNVIRGNDSLGVAVTDQSVLNLLFAPPPFDMLSADFLVEDNFLVDNAVTANGANPDPVLGGIVSGDMVFVISPATGNCRSGNIYDTQTSFETLPICALPPSLPGCPVAPVVP